MDIWLVAWISAAGPIAEAIWWQQEDPGDGLTFDDYLSGAVLAGGREDLEKSLGMLDSQTVVSSLREHVLSDWDAITVLAEQLVAAHTLSGVRAFELLGGGQL
jgi:hypothetical protein